MTNERYADEWWNDAELQREASEQERDSALLDAIFASVKQPEAEEVRDGQATAMG